MSAQSYATRADANRANSQHSTGPRTDAGKATVSTNAVRHGLTANLQRLDPRDAPTYQQHLADLTTGLAPATPTEEFLIRDLAMLKARLDRLEAAEYTALMTAIDADGNAGNPDSASAYLTAAPNLANLERTERFLRRNYMQTWSRLERMQRQRKQAATDAQRQSEQTASALAGTKQTQSGSTHSKQESTTNPVVPTPLQPTANLSSPAPAPINGRTGEANGTRPE